MQMIQLVLVCFGLFWSVLVWHSMLASIGAFLAFPPPFLLVRYTISHIPEFCDAPLNHNIRFAIVMLFFHGFGAAVFQWWMKHGHSSGSNNEMFYCRYLPASIQCS